MAKPKESTKSWNNTSGCSSTISRTIGAIGCLTLNLPTTTQRSRQQNNPPYKPSMDDTHTLNPFTPTCRTPLRTIWTISNAFNRNFGLTSKRPIFDVKQLPTNSNSPLQPTTLVIESGCHLPTSNLPDQRPSFLRKNLDLSKLTR